MTHGPAWMSSPTARTMRIHGGADLVWYGAAGNGTRPAVTGLGILGGFRGMLVRDGYLPQLRHLAGPVPGDAWPTSAAAMRAGAATALPG